MRAGPQQELGDQLGIDKDPRSNFKATYGKFATSDPKVRFSSPPRISRQITSLRIYIRCAWNLSAI